MNDRSFDSQEFRQALGCFATGVAIVTALDKDRPVGLTINSFASVSLAPPLVLWSVARDAEVAEQFAKVDKFAISVLSASQESVAQQFSQGDERFRDVSCHQGALGLPLITGAVAYFECVREAVYPGGDHLIIVGRVVQFAHNSAAALGFYRGGYRTMD